MKLFMWLLMIVFGIWFWYEIISIIVNNYKGGF
jgi:hypothetical protein